MTVLVIAILVIVLLVVLVVGLVATFVVVEVEVAEEPLAAFVLVNELDDIPVIVKVVTEVILLVVVGFNELVVELAE